MQGLVPDGIQDERHLAVGRFRNKRDFFQEAYDE